VWLPALSCSRRLWTGPVNATDALDSFEPMPGEVARSRAAEAERDHPRDEGELGLLGGGKAFCAWIRLECTGPTTRGRGQARSSTPSCWVRGVVCLDCFAVARRRQGKKSMGSSVWAFAEPFHAEVVQKTAGFDSSVSRPSSQRIS